METQGGVRGRSPPYPSESLTPHPGDGSVSGQCRPGVGGWCCLQGEQISHQPVCDCDDLPRTRKPGGPPLTQPKPSAGAGVGGGSGPALLTSVLCTRDGALPVRGQDRARLPFAETSPSHTPLPRVGGAGTDRASSTRRLSGTHRRSNNLPLALTPGVRVLRPPSTPPAQSRLAWEPQGLCSHKAESVKLTVQTFLSPLCGYKGPSHWPLAIGSPEVRGQGSHSAGQEPGVRAW